MAYLMGKNGPISGNSKQAEKCPEIATLVIVDPKGQHTLPFLLECVEKLGGNDSC